MDAASAQQVLNDMNSGKITWDDNKRADANNAIWASQGSGGNSGGSGAGGFSTENIIKNAQALNDFYKKQNEPVVAATQATKAPLEQRYKDLLNSIKGNQQVAENRQTVTTNNEMGKRGITGSSGLFQQEMTNALNPITQQYTQLQKDTTNTQNMDIANIDKAIAQLQAGNPESSVSTSSSIANSQQQANQFQADLDARNKQNAITNALEQLQFNTGQQNYLDSQKPSIIGSGNAAVTDPYKNFTPKVNTSNTSIDLNAYYNNMYNPKGRQ